MSDAPVPEELQVLAGEYVLGALDTAEMRAVRRRAAVDPALAAAIAGWERRLSPMAAVVPPAPPPPALWERIEAAIAPLADESEEMALRPASRAAPLPPTPRIAPPLVPRRRPARRPPRVWPWQLATVGSFALAAAVVAIAFLPDLARQLHVPLPGRHAPTEVAALLPYDSHTPAFLAEARADGTVVLTALASVPVPAGKALELWILPPGAKAPASLGVLPADGRRLTLPAMPVAGTALLISVEPPGGSPTGAPTGPVVFGGTLAPLAI